MSHFFIDPTLPAHVGGLVENFVQMVGYKHEGDQSGIATERARMDASFYQGLAKDNGVEFDKSRFDAALGKEEDVHKYSRTFEQKERAMSAFRSFRVDNQVPLGARKFRVQRTTNTGRAEFYRGGDKIPLSNAGVQEEDFQVNYIVMGYETNHFDELTSTFAGRSRREQLRRAARIAIDRKLNDSYWSAADAPGMYGVLDYPWLAKKMSSVKMIGGTATGSQLNDELQRAANYPADQSDAVFAPNRAVASVRLRNWLMSKRMESGTDTTVLKFFTDNNEYINSIDSVPELRDIGGPGVDGILFYSDSADSMFLELVSAPQELPIQVAGLTNRGIMFAATGGAVMPDSGNAILLLVDTNK